MTDQEMRDPRDHETTAHETTSTEGETIESAFEPDQPANREDGGDDQGEGTNYQSGSDEGETAGSSGLAGS